MNAILVANGIQDIISGIKVEPQDPTQREVWKKDNAKAMFVISTALEDAQHECLLTCTAAAEMWAKLSTTHERASATSKLQLMQKCHEYKMDPNAATSQHIARVENMARQLQDVGENISEIAVMVKLLGSLPQKFQTFVTAWESVDPTRQTLNYLRERLLTEESRISSLDEVTTALASVSTKDEHRKTSQGNQKPNAKKFEVRKSDTECFYCHKRGHLIRDCRKRKASYNRQKKNDIAVLVTSSTDSKVITDSVSNKNEDSILCEDIKNVWLMDSGAFKHITFRREWFAEFRPSQGEQVSMGDNTTCEVKGIGTIPMKRLKDGEWQDINLENYICTTFPTSRKITYLLENVQIKAWMFTFQKELLRSVTKDK